MDSRRIIVISSEQGVRHKLGSMLERRGHESIGAGSFTGGLDAVEEGSADLVILALPHGDLLGRHALSALVNIAPSMPIIVTGRDESISGPGDAFELGVQEHFTKAIPDAERLLAAIGLALGVRRHDNELRHLRARDSEEADLATIVGESEVMQELGAKVRQIERRMGVGKALPILLLGETGTGKGLLAKSLHYGGGRRRGAFVAVNCASIPHNLLESELFGHQRGAFTDAHADKLGLFEVANGGTLFLDEIGSIPLELQAKLLSACEDGAIRRVGATQSTPVDVQIIAATHEDLRRQVQRGTFRRDLYHRLNVLVVNLPPLRDRGPDKLILAEGFIKRTCREYGIPLTTLSPAAEAALDRYPFPGNVRELKNQIERAVLLGDGGPLVPSDFQLADEHMLSVDTSTSHLRIKLPTGGLALEEIERAILVEALRKNDGNVSQAARFLSITRQKLIYRMKRHRVSAAGEATA